MEHHVYALARLASRIGVRTVALDEAAAVRVGTRARDRVLDVVSVAREQVIERHDLLVEAQKLLYEVRSDEPSGAGNEPAARSCPEH